MDAEREVHRLLKEHGAVLLRDRKHLVYGLPDGKRFTMSKTPSDYRSGRESLQELKKVLGIKKEICEMSPEVSNNCIVEDLHVTEDIQTVEPALAPSGIRAKIEQAIRTLEADMDRLTQAASEKKKLSDRYYKLLGIMDDPDMADVFDSLVSLTGLGKPERKPYTRKSGSGSKKIVDHPYVTTNPSEITSSVQVSTDLVLAATQTFTGEFDTGDVVRLMMGASKVSPQDAVKIRSAIGQSMTYLKDHGKVFQTQRGTGRVYSKWRKVDMTRLGK